MNLSRIPLWLITIIGAMLSALLTLFSAGVVQDETFYYGEVAVTVVLFIAFMIFIRKGE